MEDELAVRDLAARILRGCGYTVLEATNGEVALHLAETEPDRPIHLLLTDIVLPLLSGPGVAGRLHAARSGLKVLFMSGYSDGITPATGVGRTSAGLLAEAFYR